MTKDSPVDAKALVKEAENAEHKETFKQLQRSKTFRVGIGARTETPKPSFFIEIIINLAPGSSEVDLRHLEKTVKCLKALQARKYTLTYQDGNCIACETALEAKNLTQEYTATTTLLKKHLQPTKTNKLTRVN